MFDCKEEIPIELVSEIKEIIRSDSFCKINDIVCICDLSQDDEKIIKNIKDYIWIYLAKYYSDKFISGVKNFISFVKDYSQAKNPSFAMPSLNGDVSKFKSDLLTISNGHHIYGDFRYMKQGNTNGLYMRESYLGSDHNIYLSKVSMRSRSLPVSDSIRAEVDYNSLLAETFFNYFDQPVAKYYLIKDDTSPFNLILTKNFLKDNQELIHLNDLLCPNDNEDTHSNRLSIIEANISMRYKGKMDYDKYQLLLNKIRLQYCIQSFLKLLIGPMDANFGNTAIVITHENNSSIPNVDLSPAYDLDISFNIADELVKNNQISQIEDASNKASTIFSLIKEFKDITGFKEFLEEMASKIAECDIAGEVLDTVYHKTNLEFFKTKRESYISFLNRRFIETLKAYQKIFLMEDIDETILGR